MNVPAQSTPAGRIKMSHLGKSGLRSKRASTARIAALLSDTPFAYTVWLSLTIGCTPFPLQHRLHIDQLGAIPMQFHHPPTALNRIVLAVIGRVIQQLDRLADGVDKLHHAMEKLCPHTAAFRSIVHFDLYPPDRTLLRSAESLPPRHQCIDDKIARLRGTTEGHLQLRRVFIDDPTWNIFFFAPQVMITGLVITTGISPARKCTNIDRGFTVHTEAFDLLCVLACVVFFLYCQK